MNHTSQVTMNNNSLAGNTISWIFGTVAFIAGVINTFWGNDLYFGLFIIGLSFIYFPPASAVFTKLTGFSIHWLIKIILAIFIIVALLGVGELFGKINLMMNDLEGR